MGGYVKERMLKDKGYRRFCQVANVPANCPSLASPPKLTLFQGTMQSSPLAKNHHENLN
jgi:hypothetical protein